MGLARTRRAPATNARGGRKGGTRRAVQPGRVPPSLLERSTAAPPSPQITKKLNLRLAFNRSSTSRVTPILAHPTHGGRSRGAGAIAPHKLPPPLPREGPTSVAARPGSGSSRDQHCIRAFILGWKAREAGQARHPYGQRTTLRRVRVLRACARVRSATANVRFIAQSIKHPTTIAPRKQCSFG